MPWKRNSNREGKPNLRGIRGQGRGREFVFFFTYHVGNVIGRRFSGTYFIRFTSNSRKTHPQSDRNVLPPSISELSRSRYVVIIIIAVVGKFVIKYFRSFYTRRFLFRRPRNTFGRLVIFRAFIYPPLYSLYYI